MLESRAENLSKNELGSKIAFNIPLGSTFGAIWSDLGTQFFIIFSVSGVSIYPKSALGTKVAPGKGLGLICDPFLVDSWVNLG